MSLQLMSVIHEREMKISGTWKSMYTKKIEG